MTNKDKTIAEDLEREIQRYLANECAEDDEPSVSDIARHFAEWGAEHLRDATKMIEPSEDLEKAAEDAAAQFVFESVTPFPNSERFAYECGFIAGAKWQKEQMLKDAVETYLTVYEPINGEAVAQIIATVPAVQLPKDCDTVKIIIVKEDGK